MTAAQRLDITELWVAFGTGKSFRHLAAHEMAKALGPDRCTAYQCSMHAFTAVTLCHRCLVEATEEECMEYMDEL